MKSENGRRVFLRVVFLCLILFQSLNGLFTGSISTTVSAQVAGTGLRAEYFNTINLSGSPSLVRTDATVNFNWPDSPAPGINADRFSVRWTGQVEAPVTGGFTFATTSDDGVRLWINGALVIDNWTDHAATTNTSPVINMSAGQRSAIRMEFYENGVVAAAVLQWSFPGQARQVIPQSRLFTPAAVPAAPANLSATPGDARVSLTWSASTSAVSYNVKRSTAAAGPFAVVAAGVTATTFADINLVNGTTYFYVVSAVNAGGESPNSATANATPFSAIPTIPFASTAPAIDATIDAAWAAAGARSLNNTVLGAASPSDLSASWRALWDSNNLYVLVEVTDDAKINDSTDPWQDDAVELFIDGDNSKRSAYDGLNDLQFVFGYGDSAVVETKLRRTTGVRFAKSDPTATSYRIEISIPWSTIGVTPLSNGRVGIDTHVDDDDDGGNRDTKKMWNDTLDQAWTNPSLFGTGTLTGGAPVPVPPAVPAGLAASAGDSRVSLSWSASTGATSYRVKRATTSGGPYSVIATDLTVTSLTDTAVNNGTTYFYVVSAVNAAGESGNSNQASARPAPPIPAAPANLTSTAGDSQVSLSWSASGGATSYTVKRGTTNGGPYLPIASGITNTTFLDSSVINGTTYHYVVSAVNSGGESGNSNQTSATPTEPPSEESNKIGINVSSALDYEGNRAFADAMKTSRGWRNLSGGAATVDSNGWPTQDGTVIVWHGISRMQGTYRLSFTGQATVAAGFGSATITNKTYTESTNTTTASLTYNSTDASGMQLTFTATRRTPAVGTNTGVTNVTLMRPRTVGGTTSYTTEIFTDQFKAILSKFSTLRTMDFTATNHNTQVEWASRTRPSHASQQIGNPQTPSNSGFQGRGAAWEYAVALANQTGRDVWICVPGSATDDYIRNLALLLKNGSDGTNPYASAQTNPVWAPLNSNLKLYLEFSNEVWNTIFTQTNANRDAAIAEVNRGGSPLNFDGTTNTTNWGWRRVAKRGVEISNIFRALFGDEQMMTRIRPMLMAQLGFANGPLLEQMLLMQNYFNNADRVATPRPPNFYFYGVGGSAYYNASDRSSVDAIFSSMPGGWASSLQADANWALVFGLKRVAYEGGPSFDPTGDPAQDANYAAAVNDPRMRQEIIDQHNLWSRNAGDLLVYFQLAGDFRWGFTDDVFNPGTPKMQGVDALNSSARVASTYGTPVPGTIAASTFAVPPSFAGGGTTLAQRRWLGYPIHVDSRSAFSIVVSVASSASGGQLEVLVDGESLGVVAVPNTGSTSTFVDTSSIGTPALPVGSHGVMIRNVSGSFVVRQIRVQ